MSKKDLNINQENNDFRNWAQEAEMNSLDSSKNGHASNKHRDLITTHIAI